MATFHPFPRLPAELRLQIWEMTVEPRIVDVYGHFIRRSRTLLRVLCSPTPVPAPLQTCREARNASLYQRSFSEISVYAGKMKESDRRYIWLNLDIDMIYVHHDLVHAQHVAHLIKRLRFTADNSYDPWWYSSESEQLRNFINVEEIHVIVNEKDHFSGWHGASEQYLWLCGKENVLFIDPKIGEELKLLDLEYKYDRLSEEEFRAQGVNYIFLNGSTINDPWAEQEAPDQLVVEGQAPSQQ